MTRYKLLELYIKPDVTFYTTDPTTIDWLLAELRHYIPTYGLSAAKKATTLHTGKLYSVQLDRLRGRDMDVGWWIITRLCEEGWEPFAISQRTEHSEKTHYHFRKSVDGTKRRGRGTGQPEAQETPARSEEVGGCIQRRDAEALVHRLLGLADEVEVKAQKQEPPEIPASYWYGTKFGLETAVEEIRLLLGGEG